MAGSSRDSQMNHLHTEFHARFVQVILESRIPEFMPSSSHSEEGSAPTLSGNIRVPAFNLVLGKSGATMEPWCQGIQNPIVIDVMCSRRGNDRVVEGLVQKVGRGAGNLFDIVPAGLAFAKSGPEQPILLERWTVESRPYRPQNLGKVERDSSLQAQKEMFGLRSDKLGFGSAEYFHSSGLREKNESAAAYHVVEKKMAILLRSTYSAARLLPAQKLVRAFAYSKFKMLFKVTTSPLGSHSKDMNHILFTPIRTHHGHLQVSVGYRQKIPSTEHETYALWPQIIPDYVSRATSLQLKKLAADKARQAQSPVSTQRLSSFKFENLHLHRGPKKEAGARNLDHALTVSVGGSKFFFAEDVEFPFDILREQCDNRMEKPKLRSVKSDMEGYGKLLTRVPEGTGGPSEVYQAFQTPAAPLSGSHQPKKDAANALKELKMYIDLKDHLLK